MQRLQYNTGVRTCEQGIEKREQPHGGKASLATQGEHKHTTRNARARKAKEIQIQLLLVRINRV
jgi:hypothetical protein